MAKKGKSGKSGKSSKNKKPAKQAKKKEVSAPKRTVGARMKGLPPHKEPEEGLRGIVRIAGRDLPGSMTLSRGLLYIKGIGHTLRKAIAKLIEKKAGIKPSTKIGALSDDDVAKIDDVLYNISDKDLPAYLLNRNKDIAEGKSFHVIMNDLIFAQRQDIEYKKKSRTWQGYRHMRGWKVRGQRTKNTGRRGMTIGVIRRKDAKKGK